MNLDEINEIHQNAVKLRSDIDVILTTIESSNQPPSVAVQQRLSFLMNEFSSMIENLKQNIHRVPDRSRPIWETKVTRLNEDQRVLRLACERRLGLLFRNQREKEQRELLFGTSKREGFGNGQQQLAAEAGALRSSHGMMDTVVDQSKAVLERLVGQNTTLKKARGKMLDLINSAGVGSSLARTISRRDDADALVVYGGMAVTVLIFFLLWVFIRR